jgi:DNA invertase Pin-like site-specific DNA recombinase
MINAGIYMRVSTEDQNINLQKDELLKYAEGRGWNPVLYEDHGISGAKVSRPALDNLIADVKGGSIGVVLSWKLDRIGRSTQHLAGIINTLLDSNVGLCVPSQGIDTSHGSINPASKLQLNVLAAVAEFERDLIRERTKAGMMAAKKRGVHLGRPVSFTDDQKRRAREVLACGPSTVKNIARVIGLPLTTTWRMLKII